jgi:hypothetical protein
VRCDWSCRGSPRDGHEPLAKLGFPRRGLPASRSAESWSSATGVRQTMSQRRLLLEESQRLLDEDGMVLKDATVPGVGENAQFRVRQPAGEFE